MTAVAGLLAENLIMSLEKISMPRWNVRAKHGLVFQMADISSSNVPKLTYLLGVRKSTASTLNFEHI
jgi:excinuclease UvrABC nuclease subunit